MNRKRRIRATLAVLVVLAGAGCGEDPLPPNGGPPIPQPGPFRGTEIFLRPLSIERPADFGNLPAPQFAVYNLSAFFSGGMVKPTWNWSVPAVLGTLAPKGPDLSTRDATVLLRVPPENRPPLGFHDLSARGYSGAESVTVHGRVAVVENFWMKHARREWQNPEPVDPVMWPTFLPSTSSSPDSILIVQSPSALTTKLERIAGFVPLDFGVDPSGSDVVLLPTNPATNNFGTAPQLSADVAPAGLGRREMLFATNMDSQYPQRCPGIGTCENKPPLNIWVGRLPSGLNTFVPRQLSFDSTYVEFNNVRWHAFNFDQPRWDPNATMGANARIAFLSDLNSPGRRDLWTANLLDRNGDARSDTLVDYRPLTRLGNVAGFAWHPDGTRLCILTGTALSWVDANSGGVTPIPRDTTVTFARVAYPTVFWRTGEHTRIAFQGQTENLQNIYLLDVEDRRLTKLLPFAVPVTHDMFPRWHPTKMWLVYISDYTVASWGRATPGAAPGVPDLLHPLVPTFEGMPRTRFPSPWVLRLE